MDWRSLFAGLVLVSAVVALCYGWQMGPSYFSFGKVIFLPQLLGSLVGLLTVSVVAT